MTTNKTISVSHVPTELDREMIAASKLSVRDIGRSLGEYLIGTSGEFSPTPKNTVRIAVVDSKTGIAVANSKINDVECGGFLGSVANRLTAVHFADIGTFDTAEISSKKGFLAKVTVFGGKVTMAARKLAKTRQWIFVPPLAKTLCEGVGLFFTGTVAEFKAALLAYFGYEFNVAEMVKWARCNKEKGFKALSPSTMVGTEYNGTDLVVVALPSIGAAGDGFGVMSNTNLFVLLNEIGLGELFQFRGHPISELFGYIKGCVATLLPEHVLAVAEQFFKADPETLEFIRANMDRVLVTTTDMVKRQKPGIYSITRAALNCRGTKKERKSVVLGQQAATRHYDAMRSKGNSLLAQSTDTFEVIYQTLVMSLDPAVSSEVKRLAMLKLMKHAAIVLHSDNMDGEDETESSSSSASATQDFDEVYTILSRPGAMLEDANRQGKLVEAVQSLIRSVFRTPQRGYAAYACPAEVIEIISGHKLKEGEIYLPKDVARKMKLRSGSMLYGGRDPRLGHALVPYRYSMINTYLRCVAVKGYLGRLDLLHQMDFDGDTFTVVPSDVTKMDFDAAVDAVKKSVTSMIEWSEKGSKLEDLPCAIHVGEIEVEDGEEPRNEKVICAAILRPVFGTWTEEKTFQPAPGEEPVPQYVKKDGDDFYYRVLPIYLWGTESDWPSDIKEDVIATISAISSAKGIEMADALASRAAINDGIMLNWDAIQFAQKVIEGCKHGTGGILPDVQKLSPPRSTDVIDAATMFFSLKAKTKGAGDRWLGHREQLMMVDSCDGEIVIDYGARNIRPIISRGWDLALVMAKLAEMPRTGTLRCNEALLRKHDRALAWICGDPTLSYLADARSEGADHSLHGLERLMHYYLLSTMQMRELREALRSMHPAAARAYVEQKTGSPMITISAAKRATKARIHTFALWLVFMHEHSFHLPAPDSVKQCGKYTNSVYSDQTINLIRNAVKGAGLDWEPVKNGKVNPLFAFEPKYPRHYQAINALIDDCVDEETALGILASYFFRVGTSPLTDNKMAKPAYLYFVGELVTVQMASLMTTKGKNYYCPVIDKPSASEEEGIS